MSETGMPWSESRISFIDRFDRVSLNFGCFNKTIIWRISAFLFLVEEFLYKFCFLIFSLVIYWPINDLRSHVNIIISIYSIGCLDSKKIIYDRKFTKWESWISRESPSERFHKRINTIDTRDTWIVTNETELLDENIPCYYWIYWIIEG